MRAEGEAPEGTQTRLGYFNFPQSVLVMSKSPEKTQESIESEKRYAKLPGTVPKEERRQLERRKGQSSGC